MVCLLVRSVNPLHNSVWGANWGEDSASMSVFRLIGEFCASERIASS